MSDFPSLLFIGPWKEELRRSFDKSQKGPLYPSNANRTQQKKFVGGNLKLCRRPLDRLVWSIYSDQSGRETVNPSPRGPLESYRTKKSFSLQSEKYTCNSVGNRCNGKGPEPMTTLKVFILGSNKRKRMEVVSRTQTDELSKVLTSVRFTQKQKGRSI